MIETGAARMSGRRLSACLPVIAAIAAFFFWAAPTTAAPDGRILIQGPDSSSHLRLSTSGGLLVAQGLMQEGGTSGCRFERITLAVCPLAGVSSTEVDMGPSSDRVEV